MQVGRRFALLAGSLGLALTASLSSAPSSAGATGVATVAVRGTLLVAQSDAPGGGHTSYAVALAGGDLVPVRGDLAGARPFSGFAGRLALPASVVSTLAARGAAVAGATLDATSAAGRTALRLVDERALTLTLSGTPALTAPAPAVTPTAHQQFVAAIDNKGTLGEDDTTLLGHVGTVGSYWEGESNGAISSIGVPASVTHYDTAVSTTDCGLGGGDFWAVVQEAAKKFPGITALTGGPDQLVLFVPDACASGNVVGEGSLGTGFASGGALVVKASDGITGTYAHETGHNYGFNHANARRSGTSMEYYGVYDVMGFSLPSQYNQLTAISTPYRVFQGITDVGEIQNVDLGAQTAPVHVTATIKPRSDATGLRSVTVLNPDTGENLYLDYRSGTGKDVGAFYTDQSVFLNSSSGAMHYAPGVTINVPRTVGSAASGVDTLVVDGTGDTSLAAGTTWTNASSTLSIHVSALTGTGADVTVDFTPAQPFTTVGTPSLSGTAAVGGNLTLATGTWSPVPSTFSIQWFAGGTTWSGQDGKAQVVPGPAQVGTQVFARVTASHPGYQPTVVDTAPVTIQPGTIPVLSTPTVTGAAQVGSVLHAVSGTWTTLLSGFTSTWQWRADGVDIPGATSSTYAVLPRDVGSTLSLAQHVTATGYTTVTIVSAETAAVPQPVISPAPNPVVSGTPRVGSALQASPGTWMSGVALTYQWFVAGAPVAGATGATYTPLVGDLGRTVRVAVTGTRASYPDVTTTSADTAGVAPGVLAAGRPTITGRTRVGWTLTARPGAWTPGTGLTFAWYADGRAIRHATAKRLRLGSAQRGKRITVKVTGRKAGYTTRTLTSARTTRVR